MTSTIIATIPVAIDPDDFMAHDDRESDRNIVVSVFKDGAVIVAHGREEFGSPLMLYIKPEHVFAVAQALVRATQHGQDASNESDGR